MKLGSFSILPDAIKTLEQWATSLRKVDYREPAGNLVTWEDPLIYGGGSMVVTLTAATGYYKIDGQECEFSFSCTCTLSGTANSTIYLGLPMAASERYYENHRIPFLCNTAFNGSSVAGRAVLTAPSLIAIRQYDAANAGLGAGRQFEVSGKFIIQV